MKVYAVDEGGLFGSSNEASQAIYGGGSKFWSPKRGGDRPMNLGEKNFSSLN